TTLLNALSSFIDPAERVVTIEDAAELRLRQPHVVRLESRPASVEGRGMVTIRDLLRNALRMRPDRIVIGEVRGPEALDLLTALNTGHDGALSTVHANSPEDALRRLETLALMAGGLALVGPGPAVPVAAAGPAGAGWWLGARGRRYRRAVEGGLAEIATATADALAAGRSVRAALEAAARSLEGPPAAEMGRVRADLELGASTSEALAALRRRLRSPRIDALCAALSTHQLAGGD